MAHILVMDDEEIVRNVVQWTFEDGGHEVRSASGGAEGLELFRGRPADLVIVDLKMPGVDGSEVIRELQRESPGTPILAMSGDTDQLADDVELEPARIFTKPFDMKAFLSAAEKLLGAEG